MTLQTSKNQALFPDLPRSTPIVDKNGNLMPLWLLFFDNLILNLQKYFKNEGLVFPPLTATEIATIQAIYTPLIGGALPQNIPDISGQSVFDSTNRVPKQFIITYDGATPPNITAASWKTFTLT